MLHSVSAFVVRLMAISGCDISLGFAFSWMQELCRMYINRWAHDSESGFDDRFRDNVVGRQE